MIIGRSRLSAPPPPLKFLNTYPRKFLKLPSSENFSTHPPPKKKILNPPENLSPPPPPLAICYLIMHIIHNMRQSPTSAALVVSCVLHDTSKITLKYSSIFRRRVRYIFDASWKYATIIQCLSGRVGNMYDASKITLEYSREFRRRV